MKFKNQSLQGMLRDQIYWALPVGERDYQNASQIAKFYLDNHQHLKRTYRPYWHVPRAIEFWIKMKSHKRNLFTISQIFTPDVLEKMKDQINYKPTNKKLDK